MRETSLTPSVPEARRMSPGWLIGLILLVVLVRLPSFAVFNVDAGVYAYLAQRVALGDVLYRDLWDQHPPGLILVGALLFKVFPDTFLTLHLFEVVLGIVQALLVFRAARILYSPATAAITAALFAFFINSLAVNMGGILSEPYSVVAVILGTDSFLRYCATGRRGFLMLTGAMAGLAFVFRPTGIMFVFAVLLALALETWRQRRALPLVIESACLALGGFVTGGGLVLFLVATGTTREFVSQVFTYNSFYSAPSLSAMTAKRVFWSLVDFAFPALTVLWILAVTTVVDIAARANRAWRRGAPDGDGQGSSAVTLVFLVLWPVFDFAGVATGGRFYPHYYMQLVPSLALLAGYAIERFRAPGAASRGIAATLAGVACLFLLAGPMISQARATMRVVRERVVYGQKSLDERAAEFVTRHAPDGATVYVWGANAAVNFLARRPNPTRYTSTYPLQVRGYTEPAMVAEFVERLEKQRPQFIIDTSATNSYVPPLDPARADARGQAADRDIYTLDLFEPLRRLVKDRYAERTAIGGWIVYELRDGTARDGRATPRR